MAVMHVETDAQQDAHETTGASTASTPDCPLAGASPIEIARGYGVVYGPSVLLDLLVGVSAVSLVRDWFGPRRAASPMSRAFRPVAGATLALTAGYLLARGRMRRWGATDEEVRRPLPGDELVPDPAI